MRFLLGCLVGCWLAISAAVASGDDLATSGQLIAKGEFEGAVKLLAPMVAEGQPDALMLQGILCQIGGGVPTDTPKAQRLWQRAALAGQTDAMKLLLPNLNHFSREWWSHRIADTAVSSIHAPASLVDEYRGGLRVKEDAALKWILHAAAKGDAIGLYNAYQAGKFRVLYSPSSKPKCRELLVRAADKGLLEALMELSSEYEQSIPGDDPLSMGFPKDRDKAAALMKQAAESGDAGAQLLWAHWLGSDKRQFKDKTAAVKFYQLSSAQGDGYAAYFLAEAYREGSGVPKDQAQAVHFLELAANRGNDLAVNWYAARLFRGQGMAPDKARAIRVLEHTAVTSLVVDEDSLNLIAFAYATGAGVKRDVISAQWWCDWAISKGSDYAVKLRAGLGAVPPGQATNNPSHGT